VPRKSDDGSDTIYSAEERLLALVIAAVLLGVETGLDRVLGDTTVGKVLLPLVGLGIFCCLAIAAFGRLSNDP
jgi:hypothetical protein